MSGKMQSLRALDAVKNVVQVWVQALFKWDQNYIFKKSILREVQEIKTYTEKTHLWMQKTSIYLADSLI